MVEALPQKAGLDLNPVKALEVSKGYVVVDARVMLSYSAACFPGFWLNTGGAKLNSFPHEVGNMV